MGVRWGSVRSPLGVLGSLGSPLGVLGTSRGPRVELEGLLVGLLVAQLSRGAYPAQARVMSNFMGHESMRLIMQWLIQYQRSYL